MKYSILKLGTLRVNAFEMIMGVPEELIRSQYNVDRNGQMRIGMNGLIIESGGRVIIFDPGCATFLPKSLAETYDLVMDKSLIKLIEDAGYTMGEVTDVIFTHLHFDHGSGAFQRVPGGIEKAFPNARYLVSRQQLDYLQNLPPEKAGSFFHRLLKFAGELSFIEDIVLPGINFLRSQGHTPHMLVPLINMGDHELLFAADLIPMKLLREKGSWSYYDDNRELLEKEKQALLCGLKPGTEILYYHEVL